MFPHPHRGILGVAKSSQPLAAVGFDLEHKTPVNGRVRPAGPRWNYDARLAELPMRVEAWQKEHRIVVGRKGAFAVENVDLALEAERGVPIPTMTAPDPLVFRVGNLSKVTTLHRF
jgi:hypothetical protein